jgi:hypothetical protein
VRASIVAGAAQDGAGNTSAASTSTDNTVTLDNGQPTVTIDQAVGQTDPTNGSPINFTVVFSETVTGFEASDVSLAGSTVGGTLVALVTGTGPTYNVAVSGMTSNGEVRASIVAGAAQDGAGNTSAASTSTDNVVTFDVTGPTVTINQVGPDSTNTSPINFTVVFSEAVADFAMGDVMLTGTAGATTAVVTGSGTTYNVAVSGMTMDGTVIASIGAGVAHDALGNANVVSTSTDNTVTFDAVAPPLSHAALYLHGPTLLLDNLAPTSASARTKDSPGIKFAGGNPWAEVGTWAWSNPPLVSGSLVSPQNMRFWIGLKNSDDQGTNFDVRAEVFKNGSLIATGETYCIVGVTRNANQAKEAIVPFGPFTTTEFNGTSDVISVKISTRIGTNGAGTFCGGHSNAVGLRGYFDSVDRPSRLVIQP